MWVILWMRKSHVKGGLFDGIGGRTSVGMTLSKRPDDVDDGEQRVEDENAQNRLENVVSQGDVHVLKRLHREFATALTQQDGDRAMRQAVRQAVIKHLEVRDLPLGEGQTEGVIKTAMSHGSIDVIEWLHDNVEYGWTSMAMDKAAKHGRLEVVQWLHTHRSEGCTTKAMDSAAAYDHLDVVQWLHANRHEGCTVSAMDSAAMSGHLDVVQWLHMHRTEGCSTMAMDWAAMNGHLSVVKWLHVNRTEGCTTWAMDWATMNKHVEVVEWLHENRTEGGTVKAMEAAVAQRQLRLVEIVYHREESKFWPRPGHTRTLVKLAKSTLPIDQDILKCIVHCRHQRFLPSATENPDEYAAKMAAATVGSDCDMNRCDQTFISTAVTKICEARRLPWEIGECISHFVILHPEKLSTRENAVREAWVHWILQFSPCPNEDMQAFAELGHLDAVRPMHTRLSESGHLHCCARLMYLTVVKGDFELVKWHIVACGAHSVEEWLYVATWVGRIDVVEWLCVNWSVICQRSPNSAGDKPRKTLFHSLEASFAEVEQHFAIDLMDIESAIFVVEQAARDGDFWKLRDLTKRNQVTSNVADLAAIYNHLNIVQYLLRNQLTSCTVSGFFGAIGRGNTDVVQFIIENQPDLANWPSRHDGAKLLRRILSRDNEELLRFFWDVRGMRLDAQRLNEAAFHEDLECVRLICELDLVEGPAEAVDIAAVRGDLAMLELLLSAGPAYSRCSVHAMDGAAEEGHLHIVKYLHEHNAPCSRRAIDLSARNGHVDVVQYLLSHRREGCSPYALYWASAMGHVDVVRCLIAHSVEGDIERCLQTAKQSGYDDIAVLLDGYQGRRQLNSGCSRRMTRLRREASNVNGELPPHSRVVYIAITHQLGLSGQEGAAELVQDKSRRSNFGSSQPIPVNLTDEFIGPRPTETSRKLSVCSSNQPETGNS